MFTYAGNTNKLKISPAITSAFIMAMAGMGDALLYVYLPVHGMALGMSTVIVGVLLSVNKFVRFFFNRWVAAAGNALGIRSILMVGVTISAFTTVVYALNPPIWIWVLSRILWGLSFSAMRFSCYQYSALSAGTGSALGIGRGVQELGPVAVYLLGPLLVASLGASFTFVVLAVISGALLLSLPLLPKHTIEKQAISASKFRIPNAADLWAFTSAFAVEGLLVVGIGQILEIPPGANLLALAAVYVAARRVFNIFLSPISGWLTDRFRFRSVFHISCFLVVVGISLIACGNPNGGLIVTFLGAAVNSTIIPVLALKYKEVSERSERLTTLTTSRDLGSAIGILVGLPLITSFQTNITLAATAVVLILVWVNMRKFVNSHG